MIKKGDIILSKKIDGLISETIQELTGSHYSHVFIYIGNGRIIESVHGEGVIITNFKKYKNKNYILKIRRIKNKKKIPCVIKHIKKRLGQSYGYMQNLIDFFLLMFGYIFNKNFLKDIKTDFFTSSENCTELIGIGLSACGILLANKHPAYLTPFDYENDRRYLYDV